LLDAADGYDARYPHTLAIDTEHVCGVELHKYRLKDYLGALWGITTTLIRCLKRWDRELETCCQLAHP
jgi:hypothetical protein